MLELWHKGKRCEFGRHVGKDISQTGLQHAKAWGAENTGVQGNGRE